MDKKLPYDEMQLNHFGTTRLQEGILRVAALAAAYKIIKNFLKILIFYFLL